MGACSGGSFRCGNCVQSRLFYHVRTGLCGFDAGAVLEIHASKTKKKEFQTRLAVLILTFAAFAVVLLPQGYINYQRGHWGLMPYSGVASYNLAKNDLDKSQWGAMKGYQFAGGYYLDRQMNSIVEPYFSLDVNPAQADLPFLVAASPIPFVEGLLKRLLYALSVYQEPVCLFLVSGRSDIADALQYLTHFFCWPT